MSVSHASVHPVKVVPATKGKGGNTPTVRMKGIQGMPGTLSGLSLQVSWFIFTTVALFIIASISDFLSVTAFCYLVTVAGLQSLWSFSLAIADVYALLVRQLLQNY